MKVVVIGAGVTGLAAGYELAKRGHAVTVLEKEKDAGGLAGSFRIGDVWLERFYHHIFRSDNAVVGLVDELGLSERLIWRSTPMGFYHRGLIHRFGTPLELLRFTPLRFRDRIKLGLAILRLQRMTDWRELDRITCREWFSENVSPSCYEVIWEPLLRLKFGKEYDRIPAAWIWGRIHPRARSRSRGGMKEELGYLRGGFQLLLDRLREEIVRRGGEVRLGAPVEYIVQEKGRAGGVIAGGDEFFSDAVVSTTAIPAFLEASPPLPDDYAANLASIKYQSVVCLVLECEESISPVYWLNISDPDITFGGLIEHTNFIGPAEYGGRRVAYLFNYVNEEHPYFTMSAEEYYRLHEASLERVSPGFSRNRVTGMHHFRARYGTVIYTRGYLDKMPPFATPVKGLYMVNTSQIYPYDRNMNNCAALGLRAVREIFK